MDVVDNEQTRSHRDAAARPETALGSTSREIPVCSRAMALPLDMASRGNHSTPRLCQRSTFLEDWWQIWKAAENNSKDGLRCWKRVVRWERKKVHGINVTAKSKTTLISDSSEFRSAFERRRHQKASWLADKGRISASSWRVQPGKLGVGAECQC